MGAGRSLPRVAEELMFPLEGQQVNEKRSNKEMVENDGGVKAPEKP